MGSECTSTYLALTLPLSLTNCTLWLAIMFSLDSVTSFLFHYTSRDWASFLHIGSGRMEITAPMLANGSVASAIMMMVITFREVRAKERLSAIHFARHTEYPSDLSQRMRISLLMELGMNLLKKSSLAFRSRQNGGRPTLRHPRTRQFE